MRTGLFLLAVAALVLTLVGYEVMAWFTGKWPTISYLAYHHPLLRWSVLVSVILFGTWWVRHSAIAPSR